VMDADLQHPPEVIPALLKALDDGAEFALGSRYVAGGSTSTHFSVFRRVNSTLATVLARPFAGVVRDPMSGFFALRRSTFERGRRLAPLGYKIGLELMCKCRVGSVVEVPIHFGQRHAGRSKLSVKEQFRYLEHLSRLYDFTFPRAAAYVKFLVVLGLGWVLGFASFHGLLTALHHLTISVALPLAYVANILTTCVFHLRYIRAQRQFLVVRRPWGAFWVTSAAEVGACAVAGWWLCRNLAEPDPDVVFVIGFAVATVVRYIMRKELGQDLRGLRYEPRAGELA
jgi:dolichol-phosphate mannosyltransferase